MKLRTKLILFVLGVVIIPVLVSGLIGYYLHLRREWVPSPQRMGRIIEQFEKLSRSSISEVPDFSSVDLPQGLCMWVMDEENEAIYSNSERDGAGEHPGPFDFGKGIFLIHPIVLENGSTIRLVFQFPPSPEDAVKRRPFYARFLERSMWWLFAIIVFSAVMITVIVRSFNRSIRKLERATRRIAGGDLDFELIPKGNDEIASLVRSFDSMRKNLKESIARRSRFLMGVSHDLKTPLTSIMGYLEAISDGLAEDPKKLARYLSVIGEKSYALEERIGELIDYVSMETGEWRMKQEEIELSRFFAQISELYREDASVFKRHFWSKVKIPEAVRVMADRGLLIRCFENLFNNAIRYTDEDDSISFSATLKDGGVQVVLEDSGIGISGEELGRVFEPFYRGTNSRREQGSGLGLSIVKSIVDAHGWSIVVDSVPGKSTAFTIHISPVK
jgi:signal transduction histidine kinase